MTRARTVQVSGLGAEVLSWLQPGRDGSLPTAAPLAWATMAATRRELAARSSTVAAAAATGTAEPTGLAAAHTSASAPGPIAGIIGIFFGNGTAAHPNGGILVGSGYPGRRRPAHRAAATAATPA
jgi:hypothetical protein